MVDEYLSTDKSSDAFFGNKAIIIMDQNSTPLTCANFVDQTKASADAAIKNQTEAASASASASSGMATMTSSTSSATSETASSSPDGNGAGRATAGFGLLVGVVAALIL